MRSYFRKPSIKKSVSSRTTGRIKRAAKKAVNPFYGKKGMGMITNPKRSVYNKVYNKTSVGIRDFIPNSDKRSLNIKTVKVTNQNIKKIIKESPELINSLESKCKSYNGWGIFCLAFGIILMASGSIFAIIMIALCGFCFYRKCKWQAAYNDALYYYQNDDGMDEQNYQNSETKQYELNQIVNGPYRQIVKQPNGPDNMNCDCYLFSGKYVATNRMRKNHTIYVFNGNDPKETIIKAGYTEPITIQKQEFPRLTEAQRDYLRDISLLEQPTQLSCEDATGILSRYEDKDCVAHMSMYQYAANMNIPVSYYMGSKRLYDTVYNLIPEREKVAYCAYSVYRHLNNIENADFLSCDIQNEFYEFADSMTVNDSFMKLIRNLTGSCLRAIGKETIGGQTVYGINRNSNLYKIVLEFLKSCNLVNDVH